ncbi:class I SAM-dependent methyltransferase [Natronorarus salvus]|uniref:class I SAM-dependent methyltransferase n=1 Tax=Natronorarus salvus TaxID=3117733 RepID=UPI002F26D63D
MTDYEISHPLFAAVYDPLVPEERLFADHREYLAEGLGGTVLDLGTGTGANLPHLGDVDLHAVEPDPHMRRRAERRARDLGIAVEIRGDRAEALSYRDGTFDAVLSAVVFCTIADPDAALAEVARVLKPGGEFRFLEHVRDDGWREHLQRAIDPVWTRLAGGCHLTRDTVGAFVSHDAFDVVEIERVDAGVTPARPFVRGRLRRRA